MFTLYKTQRKSYHFNLILGMQKVSISTPLVVVNALLFILFVAQYCVNALHKLQIKKNRVYSTKLTSTDFRLKASASSDSVEVDFVLDKCSSRKSELLQPPASRVRSEVD